MYQQLAVVLLVALLALCGIRDVIKLLRLRRRYRIILDTPTSRISDVREGFVELKGRVKPLKTLVSPISGETCVFWRYEIQEPHFSPRSGSRWRTLRSDERCEDFLLEDDSGVVLVKAAGAVIGLAKDRVEEPRAGGLFSADVRRFFAVVGFDPSKEGIAMPRTGTSQEARRPAAEETAASAFEKAEVALARLERPPAEDTKYLRVVEYYLAPGDCIYLHGHAAPVTDTAPHAAAEEPLTPRIVVAANPASPAFFISDRPEPQILRELTEESRALLLWLVGIYGLAALLLATVVIP